jgi:NAD(P)-dependent dehydrogenase (short-subunit alcohol dehydrogenase family)
MRQRDGAIVNISSVHAMVSWPGTVAYDVSKCGLIGLTRSVALDHGRDGIRVNALCPGYIHTPITDRWLDTVPDREAAMRRVLSLHPLGRIGTPRDVAEACLFLVSDAASFINGTTLVVGTPARGCAERLSTRKHEGIAVHRGGWRVEGRICFRYEAQGDSVGCGR